VDSNVGASNQKHAGERNNHGASGSEDHCGGGLELLI
jgi:hypothetical protein